MTAASLLAAALLAGSPVQPGPACRFTDVTAAAGIALTTLNGAADKSWILESTGSGLGWIDVDGDGWLDLFVANGSDRARLLAGRPGPGGKLFRNRRDGTFADATAASGLGAATGWAGGVAVADYDNDGDADLYVTAFGGGRLFRNRGRGSFDEVAAAAGVRSSGYLTGAAFADIDGDGWLDLCLARYVVLAPDPAGEPSCTWKGLRVFCGPIGLEPAPLVLYRSAGDGTFTDATVAAGLGKAVSYGFSPLFLDDDLDGDADLFVANDTAANFLFRNLGGGRFREVGVLAGVAFNGDGRAQASMGVDAADLDGDGRAEIVVTNFSHDSNTLYRSEGREVYQDATAAAGLIEPSLLQLGWAAQFLDADDDGELDLLVVNGHVYPQVDGTDLGTSYAQPTQLFHNLGRGRFRDLTQSCGDLGRARRGRSAAVADYDNDGDLDVAITQDNGPLVLLRNDGAAAGRGAWIALRLEGRPPSNRDGIGARVTVSVAGGRSWSREQRLQSGYLGSHDPRLHFGLGKAERTERIVVRWPSGRTEEWRDLPARRVHRLRESTGTPLR